MISDWVNFYNNGRPHQPLRMNTPAQTYESFKLAA
jgi:transposase InsO family protein